MVCALYAVLYEHLHFVLQLVVSCTVLRTNAAGCLLCSETAHRTLSRKKLAVTTEQTQLKVDVLALPAYDM
jgi:hypothetical protein